MSKTASSVHLRLPATSANLGPAFDTGALALKMHLEIDAEAADRFGIDAQGRDTEACGKLEGNLVLETYKRLMEENGRPIQPLQLAREEWNSAGDGVWIVRGGTAGGHRAGGGVWRAGLAGAGNSGRLRISWKATRTMPRPAGWAG